MMVGFTPSYKWLIRARAGIIPDPPVEEDGTRAEYTIESYAVERYGNVH